MTPRSLNYWHSRGIDDATIRQYKLDGDDEKIIIPVRGFNKYRTFPEKKYFYDKGFKADLFGIEQLDSMWCVLTEGEIDTLRLATIGIPSVSGTGGAGTFKIEWLAELPPTVFICYDSDTAGKENALKVHWQVPHSRIVDLPKETKDVSEYLQTHTKKDFEELLRMSRTEPKPLPAVSFRRVVKRDGTDIERARLYPMEDLVKFTQKKAKCLWHDENTPSMHLFPNNKVYCFGCAKSGDVIDVFMLINNCSFKDAVDALK